MVEESAFNVNVLTTSNEFTALTNLISNIASANKWILGEGEPDDDIGTFSDLYMDTLTADVYQKGETAWVWQCKLGSQTFFAYATSSTGENFSLTYSSSKTYLGICNEQTSTQPTTPSSYTWIMISGGDNMKAENYGGSDSNTVAQADKLKGITRIENIQIPANTLTSTTDVTVSNSNITVNSILQNMWTTIFGLSPLNIVINNGSIVFTFPATSTTAIAIVEIYNP